MLRFECVLRELVELIHSEQGLPLLTKLPKAVTSDFSLVIHSIKQ